LHLVRQGGQEPDARCADGVTERDAGTVGIEAPSSASTFHARRTGATPRLVPRGDHAHGGAVVLAARVEPPVILREKVHAGELGPKVGKGFFVW
jgi:hypothetical protein